MSENIEKFCELKNVSDNMKSAFYAYVRTSYSKKYFLSNGESTRLVVAKMNEQEIEDAWKDFVVEFKQYLDSVKQLVK